MATECHAELTEFSMKQIELVIQNQTGLHARPAKVLVNLAKQFKSTISLHYGGKKANAKSMVSVLTLGAVRGSDITVQVDGADEEQAIAEIEAAIRSGLGDEDHESPVKTEAAPLQKAAPPVIQKTIESSEPGVIKGVGAAPGIAVGPIFHFQQVEFELDKVEALSANGHVELSEALERAKSQLTELHQQMTEKNLGNEAAIFEAHKELLDDPELLETVQTRIKTGQSSTKAWKATI